MNDRTVLIHEYVTGGGMAGKRLPPSLAREGTAMRRAVAHDLASVSGVSVLMMIDEQCGLEAGPWQVERVGPGQERSTFERLAQRSDAILVIAPESDGILAERLRWVRGTPCVNLGCTPEAVNLAANKADTALWLEKRGVSVPQGRRIDPGTQWPADRPRQSVLKPVDGAGSLDTLYLGTNSDWPTAAPERPWLLQPFYPGRPVSLSVIAGPTRITTEGRNRVGFVGASQQQIENVGGSLNYLGGVCPAAVPPRVVEEIVQGLADWPGLNGWVGVDLILSDDLARYWVLDVNPRLTTSYIGLRQIVEGGGAALAARLLDEDAGLSDAPFRTLRSVSYQATGEYRALTTEGER